jgi:hypothetical protein
MAEESMISKRGLLLGALVALGACGRENSPTTALKAPSDALQTESADWWACRVSIYNQSGSSTFAVGYNWVLGTTLQTCATGSTTPIPNAPEPSGLVYWSSSNTSVATVPSGPSRTAVVSGVGAGSATIYATVYGQNGYSWSDSRVATVTVPPTPLTASLSGPNTDVCIGVSNTWSLSASNGTPPYTYNWQVGGDWQSTHSSSMSYTFWSGGYYRVVGEVYDAASGSYPAYVDVHAISC